MALDFEKVDLGSFGISDDEDIGDTREVQVKANMNEALKIDPDQHAKVTKLSKESGVPEFAVESNPDEVEHKLKFDNIDLSEMSKRSPNTAQYLTDFNQSIIAQDDLDVLESIERIFDFDKLEGLGESIMTGFSAQARGMELEGIESTPSRIDDLLPMSALPIGMEHQAVDLSREMAARFGVTTDEQLQQTKEEAVDNLLTEIRTLQEKRAELTPEDMNLLEQGVRAGIESLGNMAPGFALMLLSGGRAAPLLTTIGAQTYGDSYGSGRAEGLTPSEATWFAGIDAAIEVGTEILPTGTLETILTGKSTGLKKDAIKFMIREMGTEQLATLGQSINSFAFGLDEQMDQAWERDDIGEMVSIQFQRQAVTAIATVVAGGAQVTAATSIRKSVEALTQDESKKETQGDIEQGKIDRLNEQSEKSKLRERDKDSFKKFVEQSDGENNTTVFIDGAQTSLYLQDKTLEEIEADPALKLLSEQAREAANTGADVQIPVADFAADIAGTETYNELRDSMTMSAETVAPFRQEQARQETETYVRSLMEEAQENASEYVEAQEIYTQVRDQLIDTGQVTPANASIMAQIVPAWATAQATRQGKSVQQIYQDAGLTIEGPLTGERARLEGEILTQEPAFKDAPEIFTAARDKFLEVLPEDAEVSEVLEAADEFGPEYRNFIRALERDDWLGFDFPSQAINAALSEELEGFEVSTGLKQSIGRLVNAEFEGRRPFAQEAVEPVDDITELPADAVEKILSKDRVDIGLKVGKKARFWRGVGESSGEGAAVYGTGLYVAGSRSDASEFVTEGGRLIEMDHSDLPQNPLRFSTINEYQIWLQRAYTDLGYDGPRKFNADFPDIRLFIQSLDPEIDGIQISTGKDAIFVNYGGREVFEQFAGPKAVTAAVEDLNRAKEMEGKGLTNNTIRRETGWFRGLDNRWRFEISDDEAVLTGNFREAIEDFGVRKLSSIINHPALFEAYPDMADMSIMQTTREDDANGVYIIEDDSIRLRLKDRSDEEILSTLLHEIQHAIQEREDFARGGNSDIRFTRAIKDALTELKAGTAQEIKSWEWRNDWDIKSAEEASNVATNGLMYESAERLLNYSERDKPSGVFRLIRNEMQWIYREEFRDNETAQDLQRRFYDIPKRGPKRNAFLRDMAFDASKLFRDSIPKEQLDRFKNDTRTMKGMLNALQREASKAREALEPLRELKQRGRAAEAVEEAARFKSPYEVYRSLAGEVEARLTQTRQKLTPEQRRVRSISIDLDVPASEAIVIFGGLEIDAPIDMLSQTEPVTTERPTARGYYDPANSIIRLTESADLSTFLHEFAHFMYEMEVNGDTEMLQSINNWYKRNAEAVAKEANSYLGDEFDALKQGEVQQPESTEARKQRAKEQGFDVDTVYYHGTSSDFKSFRTEVGGVYFTDSPEYADRYTTRQGEIGRNIIPVYLKLENTFDTRKPEHREIYEKQFLNKYGNGTPLREDGLPDWVETHDFQEFFEQEGLPFDSAIVGEPPTTLDAGDFRPEQSLLVTKEENIRSVNAQFKDPESVDLLAQPTDRPTAKEGSITPDDVVTYLDNNTTGDTDKDAAIRRAVHEQFARGFETYLMEGKAPSIELRNAFRAFARWLSRIYQALRGQLDVNLDAEMREVFDRLLATEEQIQAAQARARVEPMFTDAAMAGMTEQEFADYQERQEKVKDVQSETLRDKLIAQLTRQTKAWWKEEKQDIIDEEIESLSKQQVYRTRERLRAIVPTRPFDEQIAEIDTQIKELEKTLNKTIRGNDTVGQYIARSGGLNREAFGREGIDKEEFKTSVNEVIVKGKPLFPAKGGMTPDGLAENLNEINFRVENLSANDALEVVQDLLFDDSSFVDPEVTAEVAQLNNELDNLNIKKVDIQRESERANIKLDHATVKEMVGEQKTDKLGRVSVIIPAKLRGMTAKGKQGIHPDEAAAFFGYSSGSEMLNDLTTAPDIKVQAATNAETRMVERHGDILTDGTIQKEADEAVQNEERGRLILSELKTIARGTTAPTIERNTIKALAEERIGRLSFREIHPGKYRKAEIRAAQEATRMLAEGNREGAAQAKMRQVMNYYLGMAATNAKNDTTKIVDRMARYNKKKVREAIQRVEGGYWDQITRILDRFEFRKSIALKDVESLNAWMKERIDSVGDGLVLSNAVLNESYVTHWKNVPYADLQGIDDSVKNIEHVARYADKLTRMEEEISFNKLVDRWVTSMDEKVKTRFESKRTDVAEGRQWGRWLMAQMTKIPVMASWLDGGERAGLSHSIMVQPMTDAYNAEIKLWEEAGKPVMDAIEGRSKDDIKRHNQKIYIPEIDDNLYGHQILAVALNTGNQSNLKKMLLGEGWANPEIETEITFQNPKLQAVLSHMTKGDWQMVQMIWDQMETLYPQLAEVHRRTTGLTPPKVEATPVDVTVDGEVVKLRGGYYPVKYDPNRDHRAALNEERLNAEIESMFSNNASIQTSVNTGATNERTGYYAPIRLSLDVVPAHFQETIHYITHHDPVREVNRLIRNKQVAQTIKEKLGPEEYAQLKPWLNDIAKDGREAPTKMFWDDMLQRLRFGVTLGVMGFKASTGIIQISGLSNTIAEVGMDNTMQSLRSILGSTTTIKQAWDFAVENSQVLEHRAQTMDREIKNAMKRIEGKRGVLAAAQEASMKHIAYIQTYMVDLPSWHAAYIKGMKEWGDEARAFQYADWVIENVQGSGATKDMARIMRGQSETGRMFTMFMTFFSSLWNMERDLVKGARSGLYSTSSVAAKSMFLFTIPVLFEMIMRGELGEPEDDDDTRLQTVLTKTALYPVQSVPFIRDIASATLGEFGYNISPLQMVIEQGTKTIPEIVTRGFTDDEITKGQVKGATKFIGAAVGVPGVNQAWATGEHLYDVIEEGEEFTVRELLFGPERE